MNSLAKSSRMRADSLTDWKPPATQTGFRALVPAPTDRAAFIGQTGSGKTTLARFLLNTRYYVVALDPKGLLTWPDYRVIRNMRDLPKAEEPRLIYRPSYAEMSDWGALDQFFRWVYERENTTLYVDETYAVTSRDEFPFHFGACLTRGRERNVEIWCATQRPARVPQIVFSESEHVYCFRLKLPQDRDRMREVAGIESDEIASLPKHKFYYSRQDGDIRGPLKLALSSFTSTRRV